MAAGLLGLPAELSSPPLVPPNSFNIGLVSIGDIAVMTLRHAPLLLICLLHFYSVGAGATDATETVETAEVEEGNCSKALGFNDTAVPKDRFNQDLQFCTEHHHRTCCEKNHTRNILAQFGAFAHERSEQCAQLSRVALCSACDGDVGIGLKSRLKSIMLCPTFCDHWFQACLDDFFAPGGSGKLLPCMPHSLVCSPLREITQDARTFCKSLPGGFDISDPQDEPDDCFDGVPAAMSKGRGPKQAYTKPRGTPIPAWKKHLDLLMRDVEIMKRDLGRRLPKSLKPLQPYIPTIIIATTGVLVVLCIMKA